MLLLLFNFTSGKYVLEIRRVTEKSLRLVNLKTIYILYIIKSTKIQILKLNIFFKLDRK